MSDQNYRLNSADREVIRFGRLPGHLPIDDLPLCFSELEAYFNHVIKPNRDRLDYVIVEERSMASMLRDSRNALAFYLTPLVDGYIVPGSLSYVIAITGWLVISLDYTDEHNEEFTALYLSPTPVGSYMSPDGFSFEQLHYTSVN